MARSRTRTRQRRSATVGSLAALGALTGSSLAGLGAGTAFASAPAATASWKIVRGPALAPNSALNGIAAVSKRLAWAVGTEEFSSDGTRPGRPLIERWNGTAWSRAHLPSTWPGGFGFVAASSASNAWALGQEPSGTTEHLLHWTGNGWRNGKFPGTPGTFYGNLGLTAAPGGRAWIIASASGSSQIFGWNGSTWGQQSYPCTSTFCNLDRIEARTGTDAWAVGNYVTSSLDGGPLALHWNGTSWHSTPVPFVKFGFLTGVFSVSATSAWAVGGVNNSSRMLLYHWDGSAWHHSPVPASLTSPSLGELPGISGDASGHLWMFDFGPQTATRATYLRYASHRWSTVLGAQVAGQSRVIVRDVATIPGTSQAWSAGLGFVPPVEARARIERYGPA
ncbi:MAG TPA: hypothetical protein VF162_11235 [Streptosporangiaceae bacterium]